MVKSRKNRSSMLKTISKTATKTLPVVDKGLKTVGYTAKNVADASLPVLEQGVSAVYGTMASGLDLGVKSAKSLTQVSHKRKSHKRSVSGGRRRTRRTRRNRRSRR